MQRFAWILIAGCATGTPNTGRALSAASCPPTGPLFDNALCVCEDLAHVGTLKIGDGPSGPGSVGVNGKTQLVTVATATGTWDSDQGFSAVGAVVGQSLITSGAVHLTGNGQIGGDAMIGGDLTCTGTLAISGALGLGGSDQVVGTLDAATRTPYVSSPPPCNCDPSTFFDVAGAVAAAKATAQGLPSFGVGNHDLHLASGNYYATTAEIVGNAVITIDGQVAVFVDGSLTSVGNEKWQLAAGATLDLFVSGDVASVGNLHYGSASDPAAFRMYVGGAHAIQIVGNTELTGSLYAPTAIVQYVGNAKIIGSVFARTVESVGNVEIDYGASVAPPPSCPTSSGDTPVLL